MADMLTEITTQSISAFIGGGAVVAVPQIVRLLRRSRGSRETTEPGASGSSGPGGSTIVAGKSIKGDLNVEIDNSTRIVVNNMKASAPEVVETGVGGTSGNEWLIIVAMLAAAGLFANYYVLLSWFALGIGIGVAVTAVFGMVRAWRWKLWDGSTAIVLIDAGLAVIAVVWTWVAIFTSARRGSTLEALRMRMAEEIAATPVQPGPFEWLMRFVLAPVIAFVKVGIAENQLLFIVSLFGAFVLSVALMLIAWGRLRNWYVYMGFRFSEGSERAVAHAVRHADLRARDLTVSVVLAAITVFFASGAFWTLADAASPA